MPPKDVDTAEAETAAGAPGEQVTDCSKPEVATKYHVAATIANEVLQALIEACKPGEDIAQLCKLGDSMIESKAEKVYTKKEKGEKVRRGIAFPTCVTPNELCDNFSPLLSESVTLKDGDLVKIGLGCHIDGFIAIAGHTIVIGTSEVTGRKADVIRAAWTAAEAVLRTMVIGASNTEVTKVLQVAAGQFDCKMVQGVQSHQLKQHVIDGIKSVVGKEMPDEKIDVIEFEAYEVYGVDISVSTGEGKVKESECRTCVFKRDVEQNYSLKTPLARQFLRETTARFPSLPFSARAIEDEKISRLGISECTRHGLLQPYPVMTEKHGEFIAQFKFTLMLLPGGGKKVSGLPLAQDEIIKSKFEITDENLKTLLACSAKSKKKKKKARQELKEVSAAASAACTASEPIAASS